jgi:Helix-turn-helix domain
LHRILEHRGISTGAKLCYIRLLGYAGKAARCYPSLEKLGKGLGVSDPQARDYVKERDYVKGSVANWSDPGLIG